MPKMKAYSVSDQNGDVGYEIVVFAERRAKAIAYAIHDEGFCNYDWTEMRAIRKPQLDKYYNGRFEMDWCNMDDRVAMVRDGNFECSDEMGVTIEECTACSANKWCERYERMKEDEVV